SFFFEMNGDQVAGVKLPYPALLRAASAHLGSVNATVDEDGVLRGALLQRDVEGRTVPLLSAVAAGLYLDKPVDEIVRLAPRDRRGQMLVNYAGKFPYLSYVDVLSGKIPAE